MRVHGGHALVHSLRGDDDVLPHLKEFDERSPRDAVVLDNENYMGGLANHEQIIVQSSR